jgi:hypothetical protein
MDGAIGRDHVEVLSDLSDISADMRLSPPWALSINPLYLVGKEKPF